jgi:hypothetical protein
LYISTTLSFVLVSLCRKLYTELPDFKAYITVARVAFTVGKSCTACHQTPPPPPA